MLNLKVLLSARGENSNGHRIEWVAINQRAVDIVHFHLYNTTMDGENYYWKDLVVCSQIEMKKEGKKNVEKKKNTNQKV